MNARHNAAYALVNAPCDAFFLAAEPTYPGTAKGEPGRLEAAGPMAAVRLANNAYIEGVGHVLPHGSDRVQRAVVFQATKFAAQGVARCGYDVYMLLESGRYVAHRPRRLG